ncbi:MAG: hypothetical protein ACSI46_25600 [Gloeotrichia echinulata DVL01]|nr:hypothetical protein [Gloeotrichia echinulata DEX184]
MGNGAWGLINSNRKANNYYQLITYAPTPNHLLAFVSFFGSDTPHTSYLTEF